MRWVRAVCVLVVAVLACAASAQAAPSPTVDMVHSYGVLRVVSGTWEIVDDAGHEPSGLTGITCAASGRLVVDMTTVSQVGVATVTVDEKYVGTFEAGVSVGFSTATITITDHDGTLVSCASPALQISGSNLWLEVWGEAV